MAGPINYLANLPNPTDALRGAINLTGGIQGLQQRNIQFQQQQQDRQLALQQAQQQQQQAQQAALVKQQFQSDLQGLGTNPTADQYQGLIQKYPGLTQESKQYYDALTAPKQEAALKQGYEIYGALNSGNKEVSQEIIDRNISAYQDAGDQEHVQEWKQIKQLNDADPEAAKKFIGLQLARVDDKFGEKLGKLGGEARAQELQPGEINAQKADLAAKELGLKETKINILKKQAELGKLSQKAPPIKDATTGRKEFTALSKDFITQRDAYNRVAASASDPSAAGDLALIFNYMKVLDPGSVVREGEFATAQNATGVPSRIMNIYNKVASGERLNSEQRKDFVDRANKLFSTAKTSQKKLESEYGRLAKKSGFDPSDVVIDLVNTQEQSQQQQAQQQSTQQGATQQQITQSVPQGWSVKVK